ncbi:MAG: ribbon-helix-helix protein, CopG family [Verrucomicrobiota bacterium]
MLDVNSSRVMSRKFRTCDRSDRSPEACGHWQPRRLSRIRTLKFDNQAPCITLSYVSTITVRIPDELKAELQKISDSEHKPVSDLVRESVRRYVNVEQFRRLRRKTLPLAEAQGLITDEDIFDKL